MNDWVSGWPSSENANCSYRATPMPCAIPPNSMPRTMAG